MARRGPRPKAGGRRAQLLARVPSDDAEFYRQQAKRAGLPITDWVAMTLAQATNRPVPDYVLKALADQEASAQTAPPLFAAAS